MSGFFITEKGEQTKMIQSLYGPFRHWSESGSIYMLADTHFDDADCKLMDPEWIAAEEQLEIITGMVHRNDTFIHLGDVGNGKYIAEIRAKKKILVLGKHDRCSDYAGLFDEVYTGPLFISDRILISHEPVCGLTWCLNIHGHDHSGQEAYGEDCKHLNLAANVCGYRPVSLGRLIKNGILSDVDGIHRETIDKAKKKIG